VKGVGEAGNHWLGAGGHAVVDALAPFGINHVDMPLKPEKLLEARSNTPEVLMSAILV